MGEDYYDWSTDDSGTSEFLSDDGGSTSALESGYGTVLYADDDSQVVMSDEGQWELEQDPRYGTSGESSMDMDWGWDWAGSEATEDDSSIWGDIWGGVKGIFGGDNTEMWLSLLGGGLQALRGSGSKPKARVVKGPSRGGGGGGGKPKKYTGTSDKTTGFKEQRKLRK